MGTPEKVIKTNGCKILRTDKGSVYNREWKFQKYHSDPEYRKKVLERGRIQHKKDYMNNPEKFKEKHKKLQATEEYRQYRLEYGRQRRRILKSKIISHYSNGENKCSCCGDEHIEFLQIDHANGGGEVHRKQIKRSAGEAFYTWLIKNNYPDGYRVLCSNCNQSFGLYGYCPHQL